MNNDHLKGVNVKPSAQELRYFQQDLMAKALRGDTFSQLAVLLLTELGESNKPDKT